MAIGAPCDVPLKGEPLDIRGIDDGFEILDERGQVKIPDVPVGQTIAALIVSRHAEDPAELIQERSPNRTVPIVFQMGQPMSCPDERISGSRGRERDPCPIS